MTYEPVLINGQWRQPVAPAGELRAVNPTRKEELPPRYPVSGGGEVAEAIQAAKAAAEALRSLPRERIAHFLEQYAVEIERRSAELIAVAFTETALPAETRLPGELARTTDQLRQAAAATRDRSWTQATIDTASGIRSMFGPLGGPVVVFGPNNFPFAFNSAAGGDFAAAIAAGNPVIAKANTGHPGTTRLFAEAALAAVKVTDMPKALVQLIYRTPRDVGLQLVSHPLIGATGFTGSKSAGLKLKEAADRAGKPIYLEMSSVNPVLILPGALRQRSQSLAEEFYNSCSLGAGQFCTNPGLVIVLDGPESEAWLSQAAAQFEAHPAQTLLGKTGPSDIHESVQLLQEHGAQRVTGGQIADGPGYAYQNTLLRVGGDLFVEKPHIMQTEAFGTVSLVVFARDEAQMVEIVGALEGNLTGGLYTHTGGDDDALYDRLAPVLREKVGRLLNDKMPTGVAVVPAMNHGGPYPATGHPGFTAVGVPAALLRFAALHCYDNVRSHRLPEELRDKNPTGCMWRLIDRTWSQADIP